LRQGVLRKLARQEAVGFVVGVFPQSASLLYQLAED
jgi:hypothetical protein